MKQFELVAESRSDVGKGASRRLRRSGRIPGVLYGHGIEAQSILLGHDDVFHRLEREAFYSHILTLKLDNKPIKVVLKDLQRHPYKQHIMHIDLQRIDEDEKLTMRVPIHFINENKSLGVKSGGMVNHVMNDLEVSCLPKNLPEYIEVDLLELELGSSIHLGELKMPKGVELYAALHGEDLEKPVVSIVMPKAVEETVTEEEEAEAEAEAAVTAGEVPVSTSSDTEEKSDS